LVWSAKSADHVHDPADVLGLGRQPLQAGLGPWVVSPNPLDGLHRACTTPDPRAAAPWSGGLLRRRRWRSWPPPAPWSIISPGGGGHLAGAPALLLGPRQGVADPGGEVVAHPAMIRHESPGPRPPPRACRPEASAPGLPLPGLSQALPFQALTLPRPPSARAASPGIPQPGHHGLQFGVQDADLGVFCGLSRRCPASSATACTRPHPAQGPADSADHQDAKQAGPGPGHDSPRVMSRRAL
jgi:hypothetical protein